jgi:hypothetical protein
MTETTLSSPMKRVEDWKSRLIDLSRKNNLLYFHRGKRGNLPITQPDQQKIFDSLVTRRTKWIFVTRRSQKGSQNQSKGKVKANPKTQNLIKLCQSKNPNVQQQTNWSAAT